MMYDLISMAAFRDEMTKLAQESAQGIDPQAIEMAQALGENQQGSKTLNKEVLKQFLKDTALVAAGTGAGYGLGRLTVEGLKKVPGLRAPMSNLGWRAAVMGPIMAVGGAGALALRGKMRELQNKRLEEAHQRAMAQRLPQ